MAADRGRIVENRTGRHVSPTRRAHLLRIATSWTLAATFVSFATRAAAVDGGSEPARDAEHTYWSEGVARPFLASRIDVGTPVLRPGLVAGFGKPHSTWVGAEIYGMSTNELGAVYAGIAGYLPFLDLSIGARRTFSYVRSLLPVQAAYARDDVGRFGELARYSTLDIEWNGALPAPGGYFVYGGNASRFLDLGANVGVYEETIRAIAAPPWIVETRWGYVAALGNGEWLELGALFEWIVLPGRSRGEARAGPLVVAQLTDHLELMALASVPIAGPDTLGVILGSYGAGALRYRWATGETSPRFP